MFVEHLQDGEEYTCMWRKKSQGFVNGTGTEWRSNDVEAPVERSFFSYPMNARRFRVQ